MKKDYSLAIFARAGTDARYIYRGGILVAFAAPAGVSAYRAVAGVWYTNGELKEESFDNLEDALEWAIAMCQAVWLIAA